MLRENRHNGVTLVRSVCLSNIEGANCHNSRVKLANVSETDGLSRDPAGMAISCFVSCSGQVFFGASKRAVVSSTSDKLYMLRCSIKYTVKRVYIRDQVMLNKIHAHWQNAVFISNN